MPDTPNSPYDRWKSNYPNAYGVIHRVAQMYNDATPTYHNLDWTGYTADHGLVVLAYKYNDVMDPFLFHKEWPDIDITMYAQDQYQENSSWHHMCDLLDTIGLHHVAIPYAIMTAKNDNPVVLHVKREFKIHNVTCLHGMQLSACDECNHSDILNRQEYTLS